MTQGDPVVDELVLEAAVDEAAVLEAAVDEAVVLADDAALLVVVAPAPPVPAEPPVELPVVVAPSPPVPPLAVELVELVGDPLDVAPPWPLPVVVPLPLRDPPSPSSVLPWAQLTANPPPTSNATIPEQRMAQASQGSPSVGEVFAVSCPMPRA
jgi:hypothetical protein